MGSYLQMGHILLEANIQRNNLITVRYITRTSFNFAKDELSKSKDVSKKYSHTLFLPKTSFPVRIEGKKRTERDSEIFKKCEFDDHYLWQRNNRNPGFLGDYVLHDGPPYANGDPHMGHAVNKIMKDITIRYQSSRGRRIHYVPGWDCHGLPIEMKAIKGGNKKQLAPDKIREIAEKFADKAIGIQKEQFKSWGIMADWTQPYLTKSKPYVKNQLEQFFKLYSKGFIFRSYMPVWWSPSSRTALAEAELEYNNNHQSRALYVRVKVCLNSLPDEIKNFVTNQAFGIVWTTTVWSFVGNKAVCFNPKMKYSLIKRNGDIYIVASDLLSQVGVKKCLGFEQENFNIVARCLGSSLSGVEYTCPLYTDVTCPMLPGDHVTSSAS